MINRQRGSERETKIEIYTKKEGPRERKRGIERKGGKYRQRYIG